MKGIDDNEELPLINISLIGDSYVGKTALIVRFIEKKFEDIHLITVGIDQLSVKSEVYDGKSTELIKTNILDTTGVERFAGLSKQYLRKMDGIMIVYSVTTRESLNNVEKWYNCIDKKQENVPVILVGNKREDKDKIIKYEEGKAIAEKYHWNFFEVSALTGEGVDEAFKDIITKAYIYRKNRPINYKNKKVNNSLFQFFFGKSEKSTKDIRKGNENKNNTINTSIKEESKEEIIHHFKEMITTIEKEKDSTQLYLKLVEMQKILEKIDPITSDISYQSNIHSIFKKINIILNKKDRDNLYLKMFLLLLYVFPNYRKFLNEHFNHNFEIVKLINSIDSKEEKIECYKKYTNNFTNFDWFQYTHLLELYNNCFIQFSQNLDSYLNIFILMIVCIYERIDNINSNEKQNIEHLLTIIEMIKSLGDILIFFIIKAKITENNSQLSSLTDIMQKLFSLIFTISNKHSHIGNDILFKIMVMYCLLYYDSHEKTLENHIFDMFKINSKVCTSLIFEIFSTVNLHDKNYNLLNKKMSIKLFLSYINIILEKYLPDCKREKFIDSTPLKYFNKYMNEIDLIQIYNGCIKLLSILFTNYNNLIDESRYSSHIVLKEFYLTELKEKEERINLIHYYPEMFTFIIKMKFNQSNTFILDELILIIQIIYLMLIKIKSQKLPRYYFYDCSDSVFQLLERLSEQFDKIIYNRKCVNLLREIVTLLTLSKYNFSKTIYFFSKVFFQKLQIHLNC